MRFDYYITRKCVVSIYMYLWDKRNVINFIFFYLCVTQDPYINRLLPLLIGTPKFMEDDCVGLAEEESGTVVFWFRYIVFTTYTQIRNMFLDLFLSSSLLY